MKKRPGDIDKVIDIVVQAFQKSAKLLTQLFYPIFSLYKSKFRKIQNNVIRE